MTHETQAPMQDEKQLRQISADDSRYIRADIAEDLLRALEDAKTAIHRLQCVGELHSVDIALANDATEAASKAIRAAKAAGL